MTAIAKSECATLAIKLKRVYLKNIAIIEQSLIVDPFQGFLRFFY